MAAQKQKMKILCLHGFRTSGKFLQKQISKWDPSLDLLQHFDMDFPDGLFPAGGKSDIEGIFPPPYFEWFQFNKDFTEYTNLEECISHLCRYITDNGPFDGLLGFSQGATLSALLLGYHAQGMQNVLEPRAFDCPMKDIRMPYVPGHIIILIQGKVLKEHPPFKLMISISGTKFRDPSICDVAYKDTIKVKSVHFIGAKDWLKLPSEDLATAFDQPLIIRHPQGHTVPRLDEESTENLRNWIANILPQTNGSISNNEAAGLKDNGEITKGDDEEESPKESQNKIINGQIDASEFAGKEKDAIDSTGNPSQHKNECGRENGRETD